MPRNNIKIKLIVIAICLLGVNSGFSNENKENKGNSFFPLFNKDSITQINADTLTQNLDKTDSAEKVVTYWDTVYTDKPLKSPTKVMIQSLLIPGWGQLDNNKKFKAAAFFIVEGAMLYKIIDFNKNYHKNHKAVDLAKRKDYTWYLAVVHLYCVLDAVTDAYLYKFDDIMGENGRINVWKEEQAYWAGISYSF
ncbi:MAG: hypothetical protein KAR38_05345 [Calditrichia bacterium]|nr:hypothetical protein [Calditrichia bacterium]